MRVLTNTETLDLLASNLAIFESDMQAGTINWASRTLEVMFGYLIPGDLEGKKVEVLVPADVRGVHAATHRPGFATNPSPRRMGRRLSLSGQKADGSVFPVEVMLLPRAANGTRVVVGVVLDLSDTKAPLSASLTRHDE